MFEKACCERPPLAASGASGASCASGQATSVADAGSLAVKHADGHRLLQVGQYWRLGRRIGRASAATQPGKRHSCGCECGRAASRDRREHASGWHIPQRIRKVSGNRCGRHAVLAPIVGAGLRGRAAGTRVPAARRRSAESARAPNRGSFCSDDGTRSRRGLEQKVKPPPGIPEHAVPASSLPQEQQGLAIFCACSRASTSLPHRIA